MEAQDKGVGFGGRKGNIIKEKIAMPQISVIAPLGGGGVPEDFWGQFAGAREVIVAAREAAPPGWRDTDSRRWLQCERAGRGEQMNAAAAAAVGDFFWFVHVDSRFDNPAAAMDALCAAAAEAPSAVHYFDLRFYDGGWKMRLNEWGVRFRCRCFGNPFGDQALGVSREVFFAAGGYPESGGAAAGEDHLFVLRAKKLGHPARPTGAVVQTAADKYLRHGWLRTVLRYQKIWMGQWLNN